MNTENKTAILVVGAPRSGTSSISNVISKLGYSFGDPSGFVDPQTHPWNPIFFEQESLNRLNDSIYESLGVCYLEFDWWFTADTFHDDVINRFRERIESFIEGEFGDSDRIALKDPRFCLTIPIWHTLLSRLGYRVRYVWCVRDLSACFLSNKALANKAANRVPEPYNQRLVAISSYLAAYMLEDKDYFVARYDAFIEQTASSVAILAEWLEADASLVPEACSVIQKELRHRERDHNLLPKRIEQISQLLVSGRLTARHYLDCHAELESLGILGLIAEQNNKIRHDRTVISQLNEAIAEKNLHIERLEASFRRDLQSDSARDNRLLELELAIADRDAAITEAVAAKDAHIEKLDRLIQQHQPSEAVLRDCLVDQLNREIAARDQALAEAIRVKDTHIDKLSLVLQAEVQTQAALRDTIDARDQQIADLNRTQEANHQRLVELSAEADTLRQQLQHNEHQLREQTHELNALRASRSWRLSAPMRFFGRNLRRTARRAWSILCSAPIRFRTLLNPVHHPLYRGRFDFHLSMPERRLCILFDDVCHVSGWGTYLEVPSAAHVRVYAGRYSPELTRFSRDDALQQLDPGHQTLKAGLGFHARLELPVGLYPLRVELQVDAESWIVMYRGLIVRLPSLGRWRRRRRQSRTISYASWAELQRQRLRHELPELRRHLSSMVHKPRFHVIVDGRHAGKDLESCLRTISTQIYRAHRIQVLGQNEPRLLKRYGAEPLTKLSLDAADSDFTLFMTPRQQLTPDALYEFAAAINRWPDSDLLYADADRLDKAGREYEAFHKPAWSPDHLETTNYIGFPACFRTALAAECLAGENYYDFVLRFTESTNNIRNLSKVLGHEGSPAQTSHLDAANSSAKNRDALSQRLHRTGRRGLVRIKSRHPETFEIELDRVQVDKVSIIITTTDSNADGASGSSLSDAIRVAEQIRSVPEYGGLEIILDASRGPTDEEFQQLQALAVIISTPVDGSLNVSQRLNEAAFAAGGELLLFISDALASPSHRWIERMVEHFQKSHVGVVGARILQPDGTIEHVGLVHSEGNPIPIYRLSSPDEPGYQGNICGVRNYSAVSRTCLMTRMRLFRKLNGFNKDLAFRYSDADYCQRVRNAGLSVVYTPHAQLTDLLASHADPDMVPGELAHYHKIWASEPFVDRYHDDRFLSIHEPRARSQVVPRAM